MKGFFITTLVIFAAALSLDGTEHSPGETIHIRLVGANPFAPAVSPRVTSAKPFFLSRGDQHAVPNVSDEFASGCYQEVYPGIDLAIYHESFQTEYVFLLKQGADPEQIRIETSGPQNFSLSPAGSLRYILPDAEMIIDAPRAFLRTRTGGRTTSSSITISADRLIMLNVPELNVEAAGFLNNSRFNIIPAGGQPGGPAYTYYVAKHEITHDQFLRFLNDAEAHYNDERGANMFFDRTGDVWINPQRKNRRDEIFRIVHSYLTYDPSRPVGHRYEHRRMANKEASMSRVPISGVSWLGAVKYCNWLTIISGRGIAEQCYSEGTNVSQWAPVTATNWSSGFFSNTERELWLGKKGFRLPMANSFAPILTTNSFNEFYKAAAWHLYANRVYGFGRDVFSGADANCLNTVGMNKPMPLPVGFFDGKHFLNPRIRALSSDNFYRLAEITGNADEMLNDFAVEGDAFSRLAAGGSWSDPIKPVSFCRVIKPWDTDSSTGFRPVTTYMADEAVTIHLLFSFFAREAAVPSTGALDVVQVSVEEKLPEEVQPAPSAAILGPEISRRDHRGIAYATEPEWPSPPQPTPPQPPQPERPRPRTPVPGPVITNMLIVESVNPGAGVPITISPPDVDGLSSGTTPAITRLYRKGIVVHLVAPAIAPNGNVFRRWLINGNPYSLNAAVNITLNATTTMTAVYEPLQISRILTVLSSNPSSGVPTTVSPNDNNNQGDGTTLFTRVYQTGAVVTLTVPLTVGDNRFQKWQMDGIDYSWVRTTTVTMDQNHTLMAIYVYVPKPIPDPDVSQGGL